MTASPPSVPIDLTASRAPLFPGLTDARLRMAITRAYKATGTPHFSPRIVVDEADIEFLAG